MKILFWLTCLFIFLPLAELTLLLKLADVTNWKVTLLTVIVTGVLGSTLSRRQGVAILSRMRDDLQQGRMPTDSVFDAVLVFAAGVLLITPGLITDTLGLLLLIPPLRRLFKAGLAKWFRANFKIQTFSTSHTTSTASSDPDVIDSYVVRRPDADGPDDERIDDHSKS